LVVVLVLGVLLSIALPVYLGSRGRAHNRAAQSDLRNALVAAKGIFSNGASYVCARAATSTSPPCPQALPQYEPKLTYATAASTVANPRVSVITTPTATLWAAARMSATGTCFAIRDVAVGAPPSTVGTWYGQGLATCTGTSASAVAQTPNKRWT
jgi:type II secretory pathway pseudopilin PulG